MTAISSIKEHKHYNLLLELSLQTTIDQLAKDILSIKAGEDFTQKTLANRFTIKTEESFCQPLFQDIVNILDDKLPLDLSNQMEKHMKKLPYNSWMESAICVVIKALQEQIKLMSVKEALKKSIPAK